ncbi:hypothetical protein CRM22_001570 [Opisthorchis felineus]|uniref:Uncharacterized protein n=1 Tax=Opisthorchis felineus TaxID=147828 RepID=A0A4S2MA87_OPIFE|nr:hypothetical protein CRM22_001570 [Opisthorchis felineus]
MYFGNGTRGFLAQDRTDQTVASVCSTGVSSSRLPQAVCTHLFTGHLALKIIQHKPHRLPGANPLTSRFLPSKSLKLHLFLCLIHTNWSCEEELCKYGAKTMCSSKRVCFLKERHFTCFQGCVPIMWLTSAMNSICPSPVVEPL